MGDRAIQDWLGTLLAKEAPNSESIDKDLVWLYLLSLLFLRLAVRVLSNIHTEIQFKFKGHENQIRN